VLGRRTRVVAVVSLLTIGAAFAATEGPRLWILLNPTDTEASEPAPVDACLVGHWVEQSRQQPRPVGPTQVATFTSHGATWSFRENGGTSLYLGEGMVQAARVDGSLIEYVATGTARWLVTTAGGVMRFAEPKMWATVTYRRDGRQGGSAEFGPTDAVAYAGPAQPPEECPVRRTCPGWACPWGVGGSVCPQDRLRGCRGGERPDGGCAIGQHREFGVDVLRLLATGVPLKAIARRLRISHRTGARPRLWALQACLASIRLVWADSSYAGQLVLLGRR
jgi:hypothetical protein